MKMISEMEMKIHVAWQKVFLLFLGRSRWGREFPFFFIAVFFLFSIFQQNKQASKSLDGNLRNVA